MDSGTSSSTMPSVMFREIHKNGVLKKYNSEKRTGFPRKGERVWAVFCLHDDTEAFIELYSDQKAALSHKPDWFVSLHNALHISPSIRGTSDEFEFAVTLPTQVVRLAAGTWESMMEWVETMRNKLRELRVLAPKENVYSKMPEPRHGLLPTRDPTSPLPLPPVGPRGVVPGVESPVRTHTPSTSAPATPVTTSSPVESSIPQHSRRNGSDRTHQTDEDETVLMAGLTVSPLPEVQQTRSSNGDCVPAPPSVTATSSQAEVRVVSPVVRERIENSVVSIGSSSGTSVVVVSTEEASVVPPITTEKPVRKAIAPPIVLPSTSNVTVIEVPPAPQSPHYEQLFIPQLVRLPEDPRTKLERVSSSGLIPRVPSRAKRDAGETRIQPVSTANGTETQGADTPSPQLESKISKSSVKSSAQSSVVRVVPGSSVSVVSVEGPSTPVSLHDNSVPDVVPPMPAAFQSAPSNIDVKDIPLIGGHQRRRRRSSSNDNHAASGPRSLGGADLIRTTPVMVPETPENSTPTPPLTLRETQVCQLQREMTHPGGVRLSLRRKHCLNAIALVDILNAVWIAGWKQREHPLLYNALHIGDQLLSVSDTPVRTAADAQKLLKGPVAGMVELVVRRLPLGKVFTLQRSRRDGDVGLVPDAAVPGEVTVEPGGVAACAGVPLGATSMDGLAITTWTLTEVNGRPLNLFCKAADVTSRLNSVGKELSILVQPSDFIKQLRKQLKNMRGYKDYLLQ